MPNPSEKYCPTGNHWVERKRFAPGAKSCRGCLYKKRQRLRYAHGEGAERAEARKVRQKQALAWRSVDATVNRLIDRVRRLKYYGDPVKERWAEKALAVADEIRACVQTHQTWHPANEPEYEHWRDVVREHDFALLDRALELCQTYPSKRGDCPFIRRDV